MHEQRGTWYAAHLPIVNKLGATEALSHHNTHYRRQPAAAKSVCQPANNRVHLRLRGGAVASFAPELPLGKALFDAKVSEQLNQIMHNERFSKLEGSWRGLNYLVMNSETGTSLKLRLLQITLLSQQLGFIISLRHLKLLQC